MLHNFKEAEKEYKSLHRQFQKTEGQRLVKYVFGIIVLPLQAERKVSQCNCKKIRIDCRRLLREHDGAAEAV
jgi:hypothetical protein